jgi:hypothetical protein
MDAIIIVTFHILTFSSQTSKLIETKLGRNVISCEFLFILKFIMAAWPIMLLIGWNCQKSSLSETTCAVYDFRPDCISPKKTFLAQLQ